MRRLLSSAGILLGLALLVTSPARAEGRAPALPPTDDAPSPQPRTSKAAVATGAQGAGSTPSASSPPRSQATPEPSTPLQGLSPASPYGSPYGSRYVGFQPLSKFPVEKPAADLRALAEIAAALGLASVWYVLDDRNVFDWDFPSLEERFTGKAWRFDNNTFGINYLAHPLNGTGMYILARGNRVGVWPAFGYTILGSTVWELAIEFQEKVSINDMIVTPGVGIAVGEFFHKLGWYLASTKPRSLGQGILAWTVGLAVTGHRAWDGRKPPPTAKPDSLGLAGEMWHLLAWRYGFGLVDQNTGVTTSLHRLGFSGEFVSMPDYLTEKRMRGFFHEADFARLSLDLDFTDAGVGYDSFSEAVLAGYHTQTEQFANTSGLSLAYILRNTRSGGYDDRQGLFLGPGLMTDIRSRHQGLSTHLRLSLFPAFGSFSALSYAGWREQHPDERTKTILDRGGYSYSQGLTGLFEAQLGYGPWLLEGSLRAGHHWSIQGLDRAQEEVATDPPLQEQVLEGRLGAWVRPEGLPLEMGLYYEMRQRGSQMGFAGETVRFDAGSQRALFQIGRRF